MSDDNKRICFWLFLIWAQLMVGNFLAANNAQHITTAIEAHD